MTAVDLDALDKLRGAATEHGATFPWRQDSGWGENILGPDGDQVGAVEWPTDAALIVAAVNALPDLIGEARRYRALREAVEGLAEAWEQDQREGWVPVGRETKVGRARNLTHANHLRAVVATVDGEQS